MISGCSILELDNSSECGYSDTMKIYVRISMIILITVFAVGAVAHAESNTAMALANGGAMDMMECQGCNLRGESEKERLNCDIVCVSPLLLLLANGVEESNAPILTRLSLSTRIFFGLTGRTDSPEPHPPRTFI